MVPDQQLLFEGAVLAVLGEVLETAIRIDLAVARYLDRFSFDAEEHHVRPDLIICVSDCLKLLISGGSERHHARSTLDSAIRAWREAHGGRRLEPQGGVTRIQAAIGNIRRAIQATAV